MSKKIKVTSQRPQMIRVTSSNQGRIEQAEFAEKLGAEKVVGETPHALRDRPASGRSSSLDKIKV